MALRTDYKDDIFSGNRKYAQIDNGDGTISFTDQTEYDQVGDSFGATQINEIDGKINSFDTSIGTINTRIGTINTSISTINTHINDLNSELTASGTKFYFDYKNGKWGWNSSPARGAGTFHPFKQYSAAGSYSVDALFHVDAARGGNASTELTLPRMTDDGVLSLTQSIITDYRGHTNAVDDNISGYIRFNNNTRGTSMAYGRSGNNQYSVPISGYNLYYYAGDIISIYCDAEQKRSWHAYAYFAYTLSA